LESMKMNARDTSPEEVFGLELSLASPEDPVIAKVEGAWPRWIPSSAMRHRPDQGFRPRPFPR
jgi:hypothetical protein